VYVYTTSNQLTTIAGATVTAANSGVSLSTVTDGGGHYGLYVPGGVYNLIVSVQDYQQQSFSLTVLDGSLTNVNFVLERANTPVGSTTTSNESSTSQQTTTASTPSTSVYVVTSTAQTAGRIQGTVYGYTMYNELQTIAWAQVTASNQQFQFTTSSGGGGQYGIDVPAGVYTVSVYMQGYQPQSASVTVLAGSVSNVNFVLERANTPTGTANESSTSQQTTTAITTPTTSVYVVTSTFVETTTVTTILVSSTESGLSVGGLTYLQVSSNSTISNLQFDSGRKLINFTASGPSGTVGSTSVVFAKTLISGTPTVLIDNGKTSPISITLMSNSTHYSLTVTYPHSTHSITIGGSNSIPEFGALTALLLAVISICAIAILPHRIKRRK
jgi:thiamine pyrophosphokinase